MATQEPTACRLCCERGELRKSRSAEADNGFQLPLALPLPAASGASVLFRRGLALDCFAGAHPRAEKKKGWLMLLLLALLLLAAAAPQCC